MSMTIMAVKTSRGLPRNCSVKDSSEALAMLTKERRNSIKLKVDVT